MNMSLRNYCILFTQKLWSNRYSMYSILRNRAVFQHLPGSITFNVQTKCLATYASSDKDYYFNLKFDEIVPYSDLSFSDWVDVKNNLIQQIRKIDKVNVDAIVLQKLSTRDDLVSAKSFANYLFETNKELNIACVGKLLKLYHIRALQESLTEDEKNHIIKLHDDITSKYPVLEYNTAHNLICALSVTKEWKKCIKLLEDMTSFSPPTHSTYSTIISTAFDNNEPDVAFSVMDALVKQNCIPLDMVYLSWMDFYISQHKDKKHLLSQLQNIFDFCDKNDFTVSSNVAKKIHKTFSELLKWKSEYTSIKKSGRCPCCKESLNVLLISKEEHAHMKNEFHKKVIIGKNVFCKTLPEEIDRFTKFLNKTAPYDMVVDGLNVSYSLSGQSSIKAKTDLIVKVIKSLLKDYKKIMFIGRKHMLSWSSADMSFVTKNTSSFFLENLSHDDPFMLYAAMSGQHTCFLSRDYMRSHKALLDEETQIIFKKWQQSHQHVLVHAGSDSGKVVIEKPLKFSPSAQRNKSWHIPYRIMNQLHCPQELQFPEKWLCLQPKR